MGNKNNLQAQIRNHYFGLISEVRVRENKEIVMMILEHLAELLQTSYLGIYAYHKSLKTYDLMTEKTSSPHVPTYVRSLEKYSCQIYKHHQSIYTTGREIFSEEVDDQKKLSYFIHLHSVYDREPYHFLLFVLKEESLSLEDISVVKKETETLLEIADFMKTELKSKQQNEYLYWLSSHLYSTVDKDIVLTRIVESLENTFQTYEHCLLLSHDFKINHELPIKSIEFGDAETRRKSSQAFISGEIQIDHRANHTYLYAPLLGNQGVYGVIRMKAQSCDRLTEIELSFIAQIAQTAGRALENVTLYESSVHLTTDLQLINDVTHRLNSSLKFNELIKILKEELMKICSATEIGFVYFQDTSIHYEILDKSTKYFHTKAGGDFLEFIVQLMSETEEPILSGDFTKEYPDFAYRSLIAIPMVRSDLNHGFVIAVHEKQSYFTFENFKLIQSLIRNSTLALTNSILKDRLEKAVITDYLTQLYSRKHLDKILKDHIKNGEKGAFMLFDIDDFKSINDTYGHHVGDKVIIQIAEIIKKYISKTDTPSRWGGEEFAVYLPNHQLEEGVLVAEKIRMEVKQQTNPPVTVSCGVSTWDVQYIDSTSAIFIRADKSLYKAKETGKNKVVTEHEIWNFVKG